MSTILHIEDAQRLQRSPDRACKPDIIDKYSRYSSEVYAPLQREGRFPDTRPVDQRIDTRPYQPSTYSELLDLEASLPKRHLLAKVQVGVVFAGLYMLLGNSWQFMLLGIVQGNSCQLLLCHTADLVAAIQCA